MNKKNNLALITIFIAGLFSLFTSIISAQETATAGTGQAQKANLENRVLQNYIDISSQPTNERKRFFSDLSAEEKANLFKLHLALQLVKRPNLTKDQKDLILESISFVAPHAYDKNNPEKIEKLRQDGGLLGQKTSVLFSKQEFFEIFADLGSGTNEINLLRKYLDISALSKSKKLDNLRTVSANDKSNLWRFQLALQLAKLPGLNSRQTEIIMEAITFVVPELYEIPRDSPKWTVKVNGAVQLLTSRALEVFSKDEIAEIFNNIGGKKTCLIDSIADDEFEIDSPFCNCSRQWADCSGIKVCSGLCEVPPGGGECGFLGMYTCNGKCQ
jgi:hypothetical protein